MDNNEIIKKELSASGVKLSVEREGKEVARAFLYVLTNNLHERPFGFIEDVFVSEELRGKGIGKELVNALILEAKKRNCYKLICTSRHTKPKVHELYQKLGFKNHGIEFRMDVV
jgi:GNAT superfamily N-acetyltransferase